MLTNVYIQKKLRELIQQQTIRTQVDADKVIKEAARIALADIGPAFNRPTMINYAKFYHNTLTKKIPAAQVP